MKRCEHGYDLKSSYHHIPSVFPLYYGGEAGLINHLKEILLNSPDDMVEWEKFGTNQLHRPFPIHA